MRGAWIGSLLLGLGLSCLAPAARGENGDADLLAQKIAELARLQAEVDQLRAAATRGQSIRIELTVCEVSWKKLQALGIDFSQWGLNPAPPSQSPATKVPSTGMIPPLLVGHVNAQRVNEAVESLRRENILKVLPMTPTGQSINASSKAYFLSALAPGEPIPQANDLNFRGRHQQVEVQATLLADRRIRLDLTAMVIEDDPSYTITLNGRKTVGWYIRELIAPCELELGTTAIFAGLIQPTVPAATKLKILKTSSESSAPETTLIVFLVTPTLGDSATK